MATEAFELIDRFEKAVDANGYRTRDRHTEVEYRAAKEAIETAIHCAGWKPISSYDKKDKFTTVSHILCGHSEKKWIRMGRWYPEVGKWYYSGTNERSQWAQVEGDEPTHWMHLPAFPKQGE